MTINFYMRFVVISLLFTLLSCSTTSNRKFANVETQNCYSAIQSFNGRTIYSGPIEIGNNAFAHDIEGFDSFIKRLHELRNQISSFNENFAAQNFGRLPTLRQTIDNFIQTHLDISNLLRNRKGSNEDLNYFLDSNADAIELKDEKISEYIEARRRPENQEALDSVYDPENAAQEEIFKPFGRTNFLGHIGELEVLLKVDNVHAQSMYFREVEYDHDKSIAINKLLSERLTNILDNLEEADIPSLTERFPHIFKKDDDVEDDEILRRAMNFLKSKEFDIISKQGNKYAIVEVKNYGSPISLDYLTPNENGGKTILSQQIELIEMLKLLELENKFFPVIALINGVTAPAREKLESYGITVLADVVEGN
jgi:hypothetical protein